MNERLGFDLRGSAVLVTLLLRSPGEPHGEELRVQDRDAGGYPADVDAGVSQARGEALQEALCVRDMTLLPSLASG